MERLTDTDTSELDKN